MYSMHMEYVSIYIYSSADTESDTHAHTYIYIYMTDSFVRGDIVRVSFFSQDCIHRPRGQSERCSAWPGPTCGHVRGRGNAHVGLINPWLINRGVSPFSGGFITFGGNTPLIMGRV